MAEILEKTPAETRWAIFANVVIGGVVLRGEKVIAPVLGKLKWLEINKKAWGEIGKRSFPRAKENLNISTEDAMGAAKVAMVTLSLFGGPEFTAELVKGSKERAVVKTTKCPWWEKYKELEINPEYIPCEVGHPALCKEGLNAINSKVTFKLTKAMPRGDLYCEEVYEFK